MQILILDDHPLITASLQMALQQQYPNAAVTTAASIAAARQKISETIFDLAVVDINLPDGRGSQLFSDPDLAGRYPKFSLLLSGSHDRDDILNALNMGATAYIAKTVDFAELIIAIAALQTLDPSAGPFWYDVAVKKFQPVRNMFRRGASLSAREHEIYELIRQGLSDKEIAYRLERSVHTIRVQIRSIRRKRGETRRASANHAA